jgi:hypothetical protein
MGLFTVYAPKRLIMCTAPSSLPFILNFQALQSLR